MFILSLGCVRRPCRRLFSRSCPKTVAKTGEVFPTCVTTLFPTCVTTLFPTCVTTLLRFQFFRTMRLCPPVAAYCVFFFFFFFLLSRKVPAQSKMKEQPRSPSLRTRFPGKRSRLADSQNSWPSRCSDRSKRHRGPGIMDVRRNAELELSGVICEHVYVSRTKQGFRTWPELRASRNELTD